MTKSLPAPDFAPLDPDAYKQQATLLKALHCAHPVVYDGKERFVQVLHARQAGGRIEPEVWLTGSPEPVDLALITVAPAKQ